MRVGIWGAGRSLHIEVADDGHGFDPGAVRGRRLGLTSMAERATELGATLHVESVPGAGTTIRLELPA